MTGGRAEAGVAPVPPAASGAAAEVAWEVTDLRAESPHYTRRRWTYTVVLKEQSGGTVWLHEQERVLILPGGSRAVERGALSARLDSRREVRLAMASELEVTAPPSFESASRPTLWIWHRLHGVDGSGNPVRIDLRFPVVDPSGSPPWEGGL
jgi:hypothetical protein